jgi:hypothetical protein
VSTIEVTRQVHRLTLRFAVIPTGYEREPCGDYWDDNWVVVSCEMSSRMGSATQKASLHAGGTLRFLSRLEAFVRGEIDEAALSPMEPELDALFTRDKYGENFTGKMKETGQFARFATVVGLDRLSTEELQDWTQQWRDFYNAFPVRTPPWSDRPGAKTWAVFDGPDESYSGQDVPAGKFVYRPENVAPALDRLFTASTSDDAERGYHAVLDSVGHNHSGVMYPAAIAATRALIFIAEAGPPTATARAMDALIDLSTSFEPLPEFSEHAYPSGEVVDVRSEIVESIHATKSVFLALAHHTDPSIARLARELIDIAHRTNPSDTGDDSP